MQEICFVSGSENKYREVCAILEGRFDVEWEKYLKILEIQSKYPVNVAIHKAKEAFRKLNKPVLVEDTGLHLSALNGFPGALIKLMIESMGVQGIVDLLDNKEDRSASVVTVFAYYDGWNLRSFHGPLDGNVARELRGENGFDFDKIFIPDGHVITLAEMTSEEKNIISHRRKALDNLSKNLKV